MRLSDKYKDFHCSGSAVNFIHLPEAYAVCLSGDAAGIRNMGMSPEMAAQYRPVQDGMGKIVKALHDEGVPRWWARIRDIRNVRTVIKDGEIYDPAALHGLEGFGK